VLQSVYIPEVQRLLHDPLASYYPVSDLTAYINTARGQIAADGECIRVLLPSTGPLAGVNVTAGGSGYTTPPTVVITGPGTGATATAVLFSGSVASVTVTNGGTGYDTTTTISFTGGGGTGATATATVNVWNAVQGQEVYTYASANSIAQLTTGVQGVIGVRSISVSWGSQKPTLQEWPWTDFQAYLRSNNTGLQSWPAVWARYGQGANGSVYVYPLPSQIMQWDWDVNCYPIALAQDTDPEAIPWPWTDCVPYYAAYLAYDNSQRKGDSDRMLEIFEKFMRRARKMSETDFVPDPYEGFWYGAYG
jgi:hypothetical protein